VDSIAALRNGMLLSLTAGYILAGLREFLYRSSLHDFGCVLIAFLAESLKGLVPSGIHPKFICSVFLYANH
jgi:hypothetical protein